MKIIGLSGNAFSGKSTIADHLFKEHGFRVFLFAKPIKDIAMDHFGVTYEEAYETKPPHARTIMQGIGSFIRECIDEDYFIKEMRNRIYYSEAELIVIDDVRFLKEAQFISEIGGIVIKVECPDSPLRLTEGQQSHESEQIDAIPHDHQISANYGETNKLRAGIDEIVAELG